MEEINTRYTNINESVRSEIAPVWRNSILRTVRISYLSVFVTVHNFSTRMTKVMDKCPYNSFMISFVANVIYYWWRVSLQMGMLEPLSGECMALKLLSQLFSEVNYENDEMALTNELYMLSVHVRCQLISKVRILGYSVSLLMEFDCQLAIISECQLQLETWLVSSFQHMIISSDIIRHWLSYDVDVL